MNVIYNRDIGLKNPGINKKTAVALGNFDGLHIGHMILIDTIKEYANSNPRKISSCVWTFSEHSSNSLNTGGPVPVPCITSKEEKIDMLEQKKIDCLIFQDFNDVRNFSPEEFIGRVLAGYLNAGLVVCGYDYRFGKNGAGTAEYLRESLAKKNIETIIIPPVLCEGEIVSSSLIRTLIQSGDMQKTRRFLGRPFAIHFPVVHGKQTGRKIGVPTINQLFPEGHIIPARGIYACKCEAAGETYRAVTNIGTRPTVGGDFVNSETHLLDFSGDLYGENSKVSFHMKIRDEMKFGSLEDLREQIRKDIEFTRAYQF